MDLDDLKTLLGMSSALRAAGVRKVIVGPAAIELEFDGPSTPLAVLTELESHLAETPTTRTDPSLCVKCQEQKAGWHGTPYCRTCGLTEAGVRAS